MDFYVSLKVLALLACLVLCCQSRPMGGKYLDVIYSLNSSTTAKVRSYICSVNDIRLSVKYCRLNWPILVSLDGGELSVL